MGQVRIIVEYCRDDSATPAMRWERTGIAPELMSHPVAVPAAAKAAATETFELLGRAFEVAQREEQAPFAQSMISFFQGAMVRKEDLVEVLAAMKEES